MTLKQKRILFILLGLIAAAFLWWKLGATPQDNKKVVEDSTTTTTGKPALTVDTVKPQQITMHGTMLANGNMAAWQEAVIGAEVNGLAIQEVLVNVGDTVKRGQVIARFNASTVHATLAQSQANLAEAQANLNEAENNARRAREVQDSGALSRQQVDQYFIAEASAKARVQSALAAVQAQEVSMRQTTLVAPDSGIISKRDATVGQVVSAGVELFRLIRQSRIEWRGEFNAEDISKVKPGMTVNLTLPDGHQVAGKVRMLAPTADSSTRNTLVYVDVQAPQAKPGMFAKGEIALPETPVVALPYSAIVMRDGFNYLMQIDSTQHIHQVKVRLGKRSGNMVEVLDLKDSNASFVESGGAFLSDGDLVHVTQR